MDRVPTVLVVDDDVGVTQTFASFLRLEGFEVLTTDDAESGLRLARQWRPDAILLDLRMPLINGLGFLYRLREDDAQRDLPVAIVTGDFLIDEDVAAEIAELNAEVRFKPIWGNDVVELAWHLIDPGRERPLAIP